jgi:hypothetical protein
VGERGQLDHPKVLLLEHDSTAVVGEHVAG